MTPRPGHILARLSTPAATERFDTLAQVPGMKLERIVTPAGFEAPDEWMDQEQDEFVLLVQGRGALQFEGQAKEVVLNPGDFLHLPARQRHRVSWTDPVRPTVWLALHYKAGEADL